MSQTLKELEIKITDFWSNFFKTIFFMFKPMTQSLLVSIIHYAVFITGYIYFLFISNPGDILRIVIFIGFLLGMISYFTFNKCFFTMIELKISKNRKNGIQRFMDRYFGKEIEGNLTSKIVLLVSTVVLGSIILRDYTIKSG